MLLARIKRKLRSLVFSPYIKEVNYLGYPFKFSIGTAEGETWYAGNHNDSTWHFASELKWIKSHIVPNEIVADVGAHHGYHSLLYSKWSGNEGKVYAFECHPKNFEILTTNLSINSITNILPYWFAIGERLGDILSADDSSGIVLNAQKRKVRVPMISLDDFFQIQGCFPTLIKIDVEGYELQVLLGAKRCLSLNPKVILELHNFSHPQPEKHLEQILQLFCKYKNIFWQENKDTSFEKLPEDKGLVARAHCPKLCFLPA